MKIDSFFIVNVLLLVALVAGASYLQNTYDTDTHQGGKTVAAQNQNTASQTDTTGWHISTATVSAGATATPVVQKTAPAPTPSVSKPAPKPSIRRLYNEDDD